MLHEVQEIYIYILKDIEKQDYFQLKYIPECLARRTDQVKILFIGIHIFRRAVGFDDDTSNLNFKVLGFLR